MIHSLLLSLALLPQIPPGGQIVPQTEAQSRAQRAEERRQWSLLLTKAFAKEEGTFFFDVPVAQWRPDLGEKAEGKAKSEDLAAATGRRVLENSGVTLHLRRNTRQSSVERVRDAVLPILQTLDAKERAALAAGLRGDQLPEKAREMLAALCDPVVGDAPRRDPGKVSLQVSPGIRATWTNPATGRTSSVFIPLETNPGQMGIKLAGEPPAPVAKTADRPIVPFPASPVGPLTIKPGRLLKLEELFDLARDAFKVTYRGDERLYATEVFVQGTFSRTAFEAALTEVSAAEPFGPSRPLPVDGEGEALFSEWFSDAEAAGLKLGGLRAGRRMTQAEIQSTFPALAAQLPKGVGTVTLRPVGVMTIMNWDRAGVRHFIY